MVNIRNPKRNWLEGLKNCNNCARRNYRKHVFPGVGKTDDPKIFFLLDMVRIFEDDREYASRFTNVGARTLSKKLAELGLNRYEDCYTTSVVKCRGEEDKVDFRSFQECKQYVDFEFFKIRPRLTVLMGYDAARYFWRHRSEWDFGKLGGRMFTDRGQSVIWTFHPDEVCAENRHQWDADWELIKNALLDE